MSGARPNPNRSRLDRLRRRVCRHRRWLAAALAASAMFTAVAALRPSEPSTVPVLVASHDLTPGARLDADDVRTEYFLEGTVPDGALAADRPPTGRTLVAPIRAGTAFTDRSLVGRPLLRALGPDTVAAPIRIADAEVLELVQVGDRVDVLAAAGSGGTAGIAGPGAGTGFQEPEDSAGSEDSGSTEDSATSDNPEDSGQGPDEWASFDDRAAPAAWPVARSARVLALPGAGSGAEAGPGAGLVAAGSEAVVLLAVGPDTAAELAAAATGSRLSLVLRGD